MYYERTPQVSINKRNIPQFTHGPIITIKDRKIKDAEIRLNIFQYQYSAMSLLFVMFIKRPESETFCRNIMNGYFILQNTFVQTTVLT